MASPSKAVASDQRPAGTLKLHDREVRDQAEMTDIACNDGECWNRELLPRGRLPRLPVINDFRDVGSKVGVKGRFITRLLGVRLGERNAL